MKQIKNIGLIFLQTKNAKKHEIIFLQAKKAQNTCILIIRKTYQINRRFFVFFKLQKKSKNRRFNRFRYLKNDIFRTERNSGE